jgi:hypothetical protein
MLVASRKRPPSTSCLNLRELAIKKTTAG